MTKLVVVDKHTHAEINEGSDVASLVAASVVKVDVSKDDVASMVRQDNALIIKLHNGETIIINNFFVQFNDLNNDVVFTEGENDYWVANFNEDSQLISYTRIDSIDPLLVHDDFDPAIAAWLLAAGRWCRCGTGTA